MENNKDTMQVGFQMVVIPQSTIDDLMDTLDSLKQMVEKLTEDRQKTGLVDDWVESEDARKFLKIAPATWQAYRDKRVIPFSQFGRKIYVKRADLEQFLQNCRVSK